MTNLPSLSIQLDPRQSGEPFAYFDRWDDRASKGVLIRLGAFKVYVERMTGGR